MEYLGWSRPRNRTSSHRGAPSKSVSAPSANTPDCFSQQSDVASHDKRHRIVSSKRERFLKIIRNPLPHFRCARTEKGCPLRRNLLPLQIDFRILCLELPCLPE